MLNSISRGQQPVWEREFQVPSTGAHCSPSSITETLMVWAGLSMAAFLFGRPSWLSSFLLRFFSGIFAARINGRELYKELNLIRLADQGFPRQEVLAADHVTVHSLIHFTLDINAHSASLRNAVYLALLREHGCVQCIFLGQIAVH